MAISYDQFTRTQLAGVPVGGTAVPGTIENAFLAPRVGGVVGAGVEVALASHWTAQFEYLFTDYDTRSVTFPAGAQRFDSDLTLSELRAGLNYRFNDDMSTSADQDGYAAGAANRQFRRPRPDDLPGAIRSAVPLALHRDQQPDTKRGPRDL